MLLQAVVALLLIVIMARTTELGVSKLSNSLARHAKIAAAAAVMLAMSQLGTTALAGKISVRCGSADVINSAWNGPMTIEYEGADSGTLTLKAPFGELTLPATKKSQASQVGEAQVIDGFGMTETIMPDLAALEACIAGQIAPGEEGDDDSYANARDACLASTPASAAPVRINGHVKVGIFPADTSGDKGLYVEVRRTYDAKTSAPKGTTTIETYPASCMLAGT